MQLTIATIVACTPAEAWHAVQSVRLLQHITAPLIRFQPLDPPTFPITWADRAYKVRMWMFGLLPMGTHWIVISRAQHTDAHGAPVYELLDDGHGTLIKQWQHRITIAPAPKGETLYSDQVVIEAGWLTLPVWLYAQLFYRYRQMRWRRLARRRFRAIQSP